MFDNDLCCICLETKKNRVFLPCGHVSCCFGCGYKVLKCPICRKEITNRHIVFI